MHRPMYSASFENVGVTAVQDLIALLAAATSRIAICRAEVWQFSDVGDAAAEMLRVSWKRGATVAGSGGSAATPALIKAWGRAAVTTARVNDTTQANTGTIATLLPTVMHIAAGYIYAPRYGGEADIDERITVEASQRIVLSLDTAPADSLSMSGYILFEELGLI